MIETNARRDQPVSGRGKNVMSDRTGAVAWVSSHLRSGRVSAMIRGYWRRAVSAIDAATLRAEDAVEVATRGVAIGAVWRILRTSPGGWREILERE
jgi:SH3-like domain-containing protein